MKIYLNCTANLGDFLNAMPVLSGIYKSNGKFDFIIRGDMKKFNGLKEFLMYQDIFSSVEFDSDVFLYGGFIGLSSWTREDRNNPNRPIETCRYENYLRDNFPQLQFEVDDDFILKVDPFIQEPVSFNVPYVGDRWQGPGIDGRRASWTLSHLDNVIFLDYNKTVMENAFCIWKSERPFITTFTGTSSIADLLNKKQVVLWGEDIRDWDNKPIEYSFEKHFYKNRNSKLMYIGDFEVEKLDEYFRV